MTGNAIQDGPSVRAATSSKIREMRPAFLITIDTEGDNLWAAPARITTENSRWIGRFQEHCQRFGFKPTYLTDYHMVRCPIFSELGRKWVRQNLAEIGCHLHPWNTPPLRPITANDDACGPYATEYPSALVGEKLDLLKRLLEKTFETRVISHRAGRWGFDGAYAQTLIEQQYVVDCSVTPGVSWQSSKGDPNGQGGPDYTSAPQEPYFLDLENICRPGTSTLLEIPVTIMPVSPQLVDRVRSMLPRSLARRAINRLFPSLTWLRPNGTNRRQMLRLLYKALEEGKMCVEFMLHSSELMPGGSPTFPDVASIERLYQDLHAVFVTAARSYRPASLGEFALSYVAQHGEATNRAPGTGVR
jgi:hypothetical protein